MAFKHDRDSVSPVIRIRSVYGSLWNDGGWWRPRIAVGSLGIREGVKPASHFACDVVRDIRDAAKAAAVIEECGKVGVEFVEKDRISVRQRRRQWR